MKHSTFPVVFFSLMSTFAAAQIGGESGTSARPEPFYSHYKNEYSFTASWIVPAGSFGEAFRQGTNPNPASSLTQSINGEIGGMGAGNGMGLDFGYYHYFNKYPAAAVGGIKITFASFRAVPFEWYTDGNYAYNNANYKGLRFLSFNIGPVLKIAISDNSAIRIYDQLSAVACWNGSWANTIEYTTYDNNSNKSVVHDQSDFTLGSGSAFKNEAGIDLNIGHLMLAAGFSYGKIPFKSVKLDTDKTTDYYQLLDGSYKLASSTHEVKTVTTTANMPANYFYFSVGYLVGK